MTEEIGDLDARVFKEKFETLLVKTVNLIERQWPAAYQNIPNGQVMFLTRMKISINTYNVILNLVADTPHDPHRKPLVFAASPLVRSLFEDLATTLFLLVDIRNLMWSFEATGYTELWIEREASKNYYASIPKWQTYVAELDVKLANLAKHLKLTPAQELKPMKELGRWPTPGRKMVQILKLRYPKTPIIPFMEFLNSWMYRTLSGDSHLNYIAVQRRGMYLTPRVAKEMFGDNYEDVLENRRIEYHKEMTWSTYTTLLSIITELNASFGFEMADDLRYLWTIFLGYSDMAAEFWEMRYKHLL